MDMSKAFVSMYNSQNSPAEITRCRRFTCWPKLVFELFIGKTPDRAYQYRPVQKTTCGQWCHTRQYSWIYSMLTNNQQFLRAVYSRCALMIMNYHALTFPLQQCASAITEMNKNLCRIRDWYFDDCLLLNASKTKLMVFGSRQMI